MSGGLESGHLASVGRVLEYMVPDYKDRVRQHREEDQRRQIEEQRRQSDTEKRLDKEKRRGLERTQCLSPNSARN